MLSALLLQFAVTCKIFGGLTGLRGRQGGKEHRFCGARSLTLTHSWIKSQQIKLSWILMSSNRAALDFGGSFSAVMGFVVSPDSFLWLLLGFWGKVNLVQWSDVQTVLCTFRGKLRGKKHPFSCHKIKTGLKKPWFKPQHIFIPSAACRGA